MREVHLALLRFRMSEDTGFAHASTLNFNIVPHHLVHGLHLI